MFLPIEKMMVHIWMHEKRRMAIFINGTMGQMEQHHIIIGDNIYMEVKKLIETKLLQYLSGDISKEALYKWSIEILHKLLKGSIFEVKYLAVWGIITKLVEVSENDVDDLYCDELARSIIKILSGNENAIYSFAMQIPQKYVVNNLPDLGTLINKYYLEKHLSADESQRLKQLILKRVNTCDTLNDILETQIIDILKLGYRFYDNNNFEFNLRSTVFLDENKTVVIEEKMISKVAELYRCYKGESSFFVTVLYSNGNENISIHV